MRKKLILLTFFILITGNSQVLPSETNMKSFSIQEASLLETITILENQYDYNINYNGPHSDKIISLKLNNATFNQSLKSVMFYFGIKNWINYTDESRTTMIIRTLSQKEFSKVLRPERRYEIKPDLLKVEPDFTENDLYFLKESAEKEKQIADRELSYEEIQLLDKNNIENQKTSFLESNSLSPTDIKRLLKDRGHDEIDNNFSHQEIKLLKFETQSLQSNIDIPFTQEEIQMLQKSE
ncbi:hypothetical protein DSECCO2_497420 [anaerobic digester metagenome]